jgi:hypothetical protein
MTKEKIVYTTAEVAEVENGDSPVQKPNAEGRLSYLEQERREFLPIKAPVDWDDEKDIDGYVEIWGESDDYRRDIAALIETKLAQIHAILESGISYFSKKHGPAQLVPPSALTLREKVALFTELLPASAREGYTLRFSFTLARLLWYESERERLMLHPERQPWLFPFYTLADCFFGAALLLEESLECEHKDYEAPDI